VLMKNLKLKLPNSKHDTPRPKRRMLKIREESKVAAVKMRFLAMKKRRREGPPSRKRGTKNGRRKEREGPEKTLRKRLCSWEISMQFWVLIIYSLRLERETSKAHTRRWRSFIILTRWETRSLKKIKKSGSQFKMLTKHS